MQPTNLPHGFALLLAGLIAPIPAVWHVSELVQQAAARRVTLDTVPLWIYLLGLAALILIAYAVYVIQLPDWSSLAVTAGVLVVFAGVAAVLLGLTMFADAQNQVLTLLDLPAGTFGSGPGVGSAATWCLVLVCITSLLALWFGQDAAEQRRLLRAHSR